MTSITGSTYLDALAKPSAKTAAAQAAKSNGTLDQAAFLKLMTTQLKTQDPTQPVDNENMIAQMAQFSALAGTAEMNTKLTSIMDELKASRTSEAASWIGRDALVDNATVQPLAGGGYAGQVTLDKPTLSTEINLVDANGQVVHSEVLGGQKAGAIDFGWDGKDEAGNAVGTGPLSIVVKARDADGAVATSTASWTRITGLQSPSGGTAAKLVTGLGLIDPSATRQLS